MVRKFLYDCKNVTEDITFIISKDVGGISMAWKILKQKFPKNTVSRYSKNWEFDDHGSMLFHDINYYFQVLPY
jgi:hypothetical protein